MRLTSIVYRNDKARYMPMFLLFTIIIISNDTLTFGTSANNMHITIKYVVYFFLTFFLLIKNNVKIFALKSTSYLYLIIISIFLTSVIHFDFRGGYFYQAFIVLLAFLITKQLSVDEFVVMFNKFIFVLSIISILLFTLAISFNWLLGYFPVYLNTAGVEFTNLYIGAIPRGEVIRNYSIFREPGVFGVYLLFGIIFELFYSAKINQKYIFIFCVALFTTVSTSAFIVLFLMIFGYLIIKSNKIKSIRNKIIITLFSVIIIIILSFQPEIYITVFSKLDSESVSHGSLIARLGSIVANFYIFITNPVVGSGLSNYGVLFTAYSMQYFGMPLDAGGHGTNSVMTIFATYGFLYGSIIIYSFIGLIRKLSPNNFVQILLFLLLMMIFSSQDMRYSLFFYVLIFLGLKFTPKQAMAYAQSFQSAKNS